MGRTLPKELKEHQFKEGTSGNPGGKSKAQRAFEKELLDTIKDMKVNLKKRDKQGKIVSETQVGVVEGLARQLIECAVGDKEGWAFKLAFKYIFGDSLVLSVLMAGKVETGPAYVSIPDLLGGLGLQEKTVELIRNRYLEAMFPGRGFAEDQEVKPKKPGKGKT